MRKTKLDKRVMLDEREVGLMRLREMKIAECNFSAEQIETIGYFSIWRKPIVVCVVGNQWHVKNAAKCNVNEYRGHGWLIKGRKCIHLAYRHFSGSFDEVMQKYECAYSGKDISKATAEDMFREGADQRTRKRANVSANRIVCKRKKSVRGVKQVVMGRIDSRPYCGTEKIR